MLEQSPGGEINTMIVQDFKLHSQEERTGHSQSLLPPHACIRWVSMKSISNFL